jgi:hypothetical protein
VSGCQLKGKVVCCRDHRENLATVLASPAGQLLYATSAHLNRYAAKDHLAYQPCDRIWYKCPNYTFAHRVAGQVRSKLVGESTIVMQLV